LGKMESLVFENHPEGVRQKFWGGQVEVTLERQFVSPQKRFFRGL